MRIITIILFFVFFIPVISSGQNADRRSVYNVALAFIEAMYDADAGKMGKCLHSDLIKKGFYWQGKNQQFSEITLITRPQLIQITKDWNKSGWLPDDAPKDISILDIQEKIAVVKVTAYWGVDYLHISKIDDEWIIMQILSQNWSKREDTNEQN